MTLPHRLRILILGGMLIGMSGGGDLTRLEELASVVRTATRQLAAARRTRDEEIRRVCGNGTSERRAAAAAQVAPSYAHRAAKHGRFASRVR